MIQQVGLFPHMTVAENVATVPKLLGWSKSEIAERVRRAARPRRPARPRLPLPLRVAALRRRAPARRPRARARGRPAGDADGRAVRRPRPDHPHPPAEGAAADPAASCGRRSSSSRTTSTRRSSSATGSRSCARAASSPSTTRRTELLAHPADDFVARFVGADRGLKRLSLTRLGRTSSSSPANGAVRPVCSTPHDAPRRALGDAERRRAGAVVVEARTEPKRVLTLDRLTELLDVTAEPVIPDFGEASDCVSENRLLLHRLGPRELGSRAAAGAHRAHRADADRGRHRLRHLARPRRCSRTACATSNGRSRSSRR